ncbi:Peptidase S8 subtilisin-related protein [Dioscorea alata]|uniref:Peptidase S8 subtilisin-related protein n=1 Tax=Dioscorea alata TaxID=55571 RepID=A0ACB7VMI5_DIOAL|nr:Peptidase S8 subtilisin-related protein [Dioscorea alata]
MEGIVSVFPSRTLHLHTTRSWDFLGLPSTTKHSLTLESDVIIGMIDTGIWPESKSFSDEGLGQPPKRWKGTCHKSFPCNNKIIGTRDYIRNSTGNNTPAIDVDGHGSHTASTAAGRNVANVSLYGLAKGDSRGGVPGARLAIYKACWSGGCRGADILAAFDDAIADGVDIISISVGGKPNDYFKDEIAIGSFHAMKNGILTCASSGNDGPNLGSVANVAPWLISVAASSIDRHIVDKLVIGENRTVEGASVNPFPSQTKSFPFVYDSRYVFALQHNKSYIYVYILFDVHHVFVLNLCSCVPDDMNDDPLGEIVLLCDGDLDAAGELDDLVKGVVMIDDSYLDYGFQYPLPALDVSKAIGEEIKKYINETKNPIAKILKSQEIFDSNAPVIVSFSSRGPNIITPDILKPDISAPGVNIIAAWSPNASISDDDADNRSVVYNIQSGTSMACPHVSGAAAYVKSFNPFWSPSAIMSALITTATPIKATHNLEAELAYGAGQLNPVKALNPGLVYEATEADYVQMLCNQGYNAKNLQIITGNNSTCNSSHNNIGSTVRDLNYPSMAFNATADKPVSVNFSRTITNVGNEKSIYKAMITSNSNLKIIVNPSALHFESLNQKLKFTVTISGPQMRSKSVASAALVWSDGQYSVRSPILVYTM